MTPRSLAPPAAALGGAFWTVRWLMGGPEVDRSAGDVLHWLGLVLLALALAVVGAGLVSRSAAGLRALVAVAFPVLVWSVVEVVRPSGDAHVFDGLVGVIALVAALVVLALRRKGADRDRPRPRPRSRRGAHAA
ncbi:hypothetical protein DDE18_02870 [Nocardioides gansuensis]|uniref:Uncharacterized protein n=1 Tax=Nocardioides gansuensis TaxID=2138300 RepID=A0A2T8FFS7_9ACTN|nr:hypothetical protein [Nocardioides gansuensis]PVG84563.1 hypothetical protein DDE18_02870 [Nocardioides gansuensis]